MLEMVERIRVLHIDDEPDFAETTASLLEYEDSRFDIETAVSVSDGLARIATDEVDCIVSDYELGDRTGIELLKEVRNEYPELPFILFTGKGSEEVASQAFSAGATDYLQKKGGTSQYEVLANRIQNAVKQYQTIRAQQWLVNLVENTDRVVFSFTADWDDVLFVSDSYEDVWGRTIATLQSDPTDFLQGIHPDDCERVRNAMDSVSEGTQLDIGFRVNPDEDYGRWVQAHMEPIGTGTDTGNRIGGFAADITEHRRRQDRHRRQRETLLKLATDDAVTSGDFQTAVQRVTEAAARVLEVPRVNVWLVDGTADTAVLECIDHYDSQTDSHIQGPELVCEDYPAYLQALESHQAIDAVDALADPRTAELHDYLTDNDIGALLDGTLRSEGEVIGVVCHEHVGETREWTDDEIDFASDIADIVHRALRNRERKEHEEELEQYRSYVDRVFDTIDDVFFVLAEDGSLIRWNDSLTEVTGYTDTEIESMDPVDFVAEADQDEAVAAIERVIKEGHAQLEASLVTKDGTTIPYEFVADRVTHPDGTMRLVGIGRDISTRLEREQKLERIREQMAFALDITDSILWAIDLETEKLTDYGPIERVFGANPEGVDDFIENVVHPDDRETVSKVFDEIRERNTEEFNVEFRTVPSPDETKWVLSRGYIQDVETQEPDKLVGLATDITERRKRERELQRQNDRLEEFTENRGESPVLQRGDESDSR
jgi:PAS domain S-box-containing protein